MSTEPQSLSNNINALGELVERCGYQLITRYLSEMVLNWHVDPQSEDAKIWRDLNAKMTAAVDAYPKEHWRPRIAALLNVGGGK